MRNLAYWKEKAVQMRNLVNMQPHGNFTEELRKDLTFALRKIEQIERQVLK